MSVQPVLDRRIDEALRRLIRPPSEDRLRAIAEDAVRKVASTRRRPSVRRRGLAVAAAVVFAVGGGWQLYQALRPAASPGGTYQRQPWRSLHQVYGDWLVDGFRPAWVCADEREFAASFRSVLDQGLRLGELPAGTTVLGLSYCHSITPQTTCLLARADGRPVVVFVDRLERDTPQPDPPGLRLFRRQVGQLVLYELTPLEEAAVLPSFINAEPGPPWPGRPPAAERRTPP